MTCIIFIFDYRNFCVLVNPIRFRVQTPNSNSVLQTRIQTPDPDSGFRLRIPTPDFPLRIPTPDFPLRISHSGFRLRIPTPDSKSGLQVPTMDTQLCFPTPDPNSGCQFWHWIRLPTEFHVIFWKSKSQDWQTAPVILKFIQEPGFQTISKVELGYNVNDDDLIRAINYHNCYTVLAIKQK